MRAPIKILLIKFVFAIVLGYEFWQLYKDLSIGVWDEGTFLTVITLSFVIYFLWFILRIEKKAEQFRRATDLSMNDFKESLNRAIRESFREPFNPYRKYRNDDDIGKP